MRMVRTLFGGLVLAAAITGMARADVTVSTATDPTAQLGAQMSALLGTERATVRDLPEARLTAIAAGPEAPAARPSAATEAGKTAEAPLVGGTPRDLTIRYDTVWLATLPAPSGGADWECLRRAIYFEARGESIKGQVAVAEVVLNRVDSRRFAGSVCAVVNQRGGGGCQFSFICDGISDQMSESGALDRAGRIARLMLDGAPRGLTAGATYFHTSGVRPSWAHQFDRTASIGSHYFYRQD
jgi:spore germination cell wall hydrolase CwlJ-like protein